MKNILPGIAVPTAGLLAIALATGCGDGGAAAILGRVARPAASQPAGAAAPRITALDTGALDFTKKAVVLSTGIEMKYVEVGNLDSGEAIVLLHGYTDSSRSFYPTIEALLALNPDLHIYGPDLRGHGESSMPSGAACAADPKTCFEMPDFADDLFAFMEAKGIQSAHLVGHSMGSLVAQQMALSRPDKVESMVLIGTAATVVDNPVAEDFLRQATIEGNGDDVDGLWKSALEADPRFGEWPRDAYQLTPLDADPDARAWMESNWVTEASADPEWLGEIAHESANVRLGTWLGAIEAVLAVDNTVALADLRVDSLTLWATQDVVSPEADQTRLRAALAAAATACNSGHIWKRYGKEPLPEHGQTDLGHNTQWGAPAQIAADINAYITHSVPTPDLYFADPEDPTDIQTESGSAEIIEMPAMTGCNAYGESLAHSPHGTWLGKGRNALLPIAGPETVADTL